MKKELFVQQNLLTNYMASIQKSTLCHTEVTYMYNEHICMNNIDIVF